MDTRIAATKMLPLIEKAQLPDSDPEIGKDHLRDMVELIQSGSVSGEKAHRWLGWIQGCVCVGKGATLEDLKSVNFWA